ncbi:uncharacterized protein LOC115395894 [Salarias fasciatus]|uniref:Uncharacterized LOC115395894 n=1 Tax=Salarias fasciatus TaxID=181472 RepID=A0A672GAL7_SALFA|nr:uncharacterized protein LOC115395894 [Salarias fasciatus]
MTPPKFVFYLTCLLLGKLVKMDHLKQPAAVLQDRRFVSIDIGDSLKLKCLGDNEAMKIFWYKQILGQKPELICSTYKYGTNGTFHNEFHNNPRFTVENTDGESALKISQLQVSDTGTYFCARSVSFMFEFEEGTTVSVKGSGLNTEVWVQQLRTDTVQSEGFDTLSCTVETGSCNEEHSVYWFKNSDEVFYTYGTNNSRCKRKPSTQSLSCVYNLPIKNLNRSPAGTYYCAIASCGYILFGNSTTLNYQGKLNSPGLVYFLSGALAVTVVLSVVLTVLLYKLNKRSRCQSTEGQARFSAPSMPEAESCEGAEDLHYAALNMNRSLKSKRQTVNTNSECVYSRIQK